MTSADFSFIVRDNNQAAQAALSRKDYVQAFLLVHTLVESLLRIFLQIPDDNVKFSKLIQIYKEFLEKASPGVVTFIDELAKFNQLRNRIVHELWEKGYTYINRKAENAASAAVLMYGLFIEFLQTYDPELENRGYRYSESS